MKAPLGALLLLAAYVAVEAQYYYDSPWGYPSSYEVDDYSPEYASPYSFYEPEPTFRQSRGGGKGGFWYYWGPGYGQKGWGGGGGQVLGGGLGGAGGGGGGYGGGGGGYGGGGYGGGGGGGGFGGGGGGSGGGGGGGHGWGWKPRPVKYINHQPPKFPYSPPPIIHAAGPVIKRHQPYYVQKPKGWGWGWK